MWRRLVVAALLAAAAWQPQPAEAGWGVLDQVEETYNDVKDTIGDTWDELAEQVTDGFSELVGWLTEKASAAAAAVGEVIAELHEVTEEALDWARSNGLLKEETWARIADAAKLVFSQLAEDTMALIKDGLDALAELADNVTVPYPLNVLDDDDLGDLAACMGTAVFELAKEFTQGVATTLVEVGTRVDVDALLNTEGLEDELAAMNQCLQQIGDELQARYDPNELQEAVQEWFEFEETVVALELSFTACTLSCASASLGFAVSADASEGVKAAPYRSLSVGVDTGTLVGATLGMDIAFLPRWNLTGEYHSVSFMDLPIELLDLPDVSMSIADDGVFGGFELAADIVDISFELTGSFSVGYDYEVVEWLRSFEDLAKVWTNVTNIAEDALEDLSKVVEAVEGIVQGLREGCLFASSSQSSSSSSSSSQQQSTPQLTLACPSTENNSAAVSTLPVSYIEIYDAHYGNLEGQHVCNSSHSYEVVRALCQWESSCTVPVAEATFGDDPCPELEKSLEVLYGCPMTKSVFDLGCFATTYADVKEFVQEGDDDETLGDDWESRTNGIAKCAKVAYEHGWPGFALYEHGMCLAGATLLDEGVYNAAGFASECPEDGLGDPSSMNVYAFATDDLFMDSMGCFPLSVLPDDGQDMEQVHHLTQDNYTTRSSAISKCAQIAYESGYAGFAVSDGGACSVSQSFAREPIENMTGLTAANRSECGFGKGNATSMSLYTFPAGAAKSSSSSSSAAAAAAADEGLTGGEIALIVGGVVAGLAR